MTHNWLKSHKSLVTMLKVKSTKDRQNDNKTNKYGPLTNKLNTRELLSLIVFALVYNQVSNELSYYDGLVQRFELYLLK